MMWNSAEHFKSSLREGLNGSLNLTRFAVTGGFVMGALQQSEITKGHMISPIRYLTTMSLHSATGEIIIERHDDQVLLTADGALPLTRCDNACTSYLIGQEVVILRTGASATRREIHDMFERFQAQGSGTISEIAEVYRDLEQTSPTEDFFNPANRNAHASVLEVFAHSHTWIDPLAALVESLRRRAP